MNSCFPDGIKAWNNGIEHFPNTPSINILEGHILSLVRPKKEIFSTYMTSIPLLFENELTPFKGTQNRHEFDDTPSDTPSL